MKFGDLIPFEQSVDERSNCLHRRIKAIQRTDGAGCENCGYPLWSHSKERVNHGSGQYSYDYECPGKTDLFGGDER